MFLVNKKVNMPPVLRLTGRVSYRGGRVMMKCHSTRAFLGRRFRRGKRLCVSARSKDIKAGKGIVSTVHRGTLRTSVVCTYKPAPVLHTVGRCTRRGKVRYCVSLRREVTYNVNTYLTYMYGSGRGSTRDGMGGGHVYGSNPMFLSARIRVW